MIRQSYVDGAADAEGRTIGKPNAANRCGSRKMVKAAIASSCRVSNHGAV